jgi:hypothetical protein
MRITHIALALTSLFLAQSVFAQDMDSDSKPCATIAKACLDAGYLRDSQDKKFWQDCMKPIVLGQTVANVTVDADTVKMCRADKIAKMKKELAELQKAFSGSSMGTTTTK